MLRPSLAKFLSLILVLFLLCVLCASVLKTTFNFNLDRNAERNSYGRIPTREASPALAAAEKQIPLGQIPFKACASTSSRKCFKTDCTGAGTICPNPQIEVRLIAEQSSSTSPKSARYCFSVSPPCVHRTKRSVIFCDPTRQGTHFPQDSFR